VGILGGKGRLFTVEEVVMLNLDLWERWWGRKGSNFGCWFWAFFDLFFNYVFTLLMIEALLWRLKQAKVVDLKNSNVWNFSTVPLHEDQLFFFFLLGFLFLVCVNTIYPSLTYLFLMHVYVLNISANANAYYLLRTLYLTLRLSRSV
jgi:hypothetical protein